mgnify:CR=1 FL=1
MKLGASNLMVPTQLENSGFEQFWGENVFFFISLNIIGNIPVTYHTVLTASVV